MDSLISDLRQGLRQLIQKPAFSAAVIAPAATDLLFGLAPALSTSKPQLVPAPARRHRQRDARARVLARRSGRTATLRRPFNSTPYEIVGVSRDHKVRSVGETPRPYLQLPDTPSRTIGLVVRTQLPADQALPSLRQALRSLEPNIQFTDDAPASDVAATTVAPTRIGAMAVGAFGALALILAAVGLYARCCSVRAGGLPAPAWR